MEIVHPGEDDLVGDFPMIDGIQLVTMRHDSYDAVDRHFDSEVTINHDGRFVAFPSRSGLLVDDEQTSDRSRNVFRFDRLLSHNRLVNLRADGVKLDESSRSASVSGDGRWVAFESGASNLIKGEGSGNQHVFVKDMLGGTLEAISLSTDLAGETRVNARNPRISANGRFVAFETDYEFSTGSGIMVWVYDRVTGSYSAAVPRIDDGQFVPGDYHLNGISGDGRYVLINTNVELDSRHTDGVENMYRFDRISGRAELVSVSYDGGESGDSFSDEGAISHDGRYAAFRSDATNLVSGFNMGTGRARIYLRDMVGGTTALCSVGYDGADVDNESWSPSISGDGRYVAFHSAAMNLVNEDYDDEDDVFVFDRVSGQVRRLANPPYGFDGSDAPQYTRQRHPAISGDGRYVAYVRDGGSDRGMVLVAPNPFYATVGEETPIARPEDLIGG